ncbi:flap endonuclease-1 [Methanocella arvoryzae]|uniref:Flap endonuclease 1 n=1 Tax=Methanocella arvoryzae (strain DSM 22066 / NBRC 105507 / MRE50) TaxID=351160 RepID=FEN_METAR|nr:flap endonuclease-1 [Methanocella arvoryzae]Q0W6I0.1 RecName: Full=Flap endonuclease 1; Short=FEN-1; AltName: Full=Flap structure-specific endonuclease 1 [Methanocella arvoryzae MRE50]CAJ36013.1 flap structure-specific endonuclease [Methanocella arvoryzae MRE50]
MGVDLGGLVEPREIELKELNNRTVAVDAYNTLYQFLSIIRQQDGAPLADDRGNVTSHLSGIIYRVTNLVEEGMKPVFVFDGKPPSFKAETIKARAEVREAARQMYEAAKAAGSAEAYKYAQASTSINRQIVDDAKVLLGYMGIPFIVAPSEGEAQAAYMVSRGAADYVGSQDYDSLLFGAPRVVRNIAITGKRKVPRKNIYMDVKPEVIELQEVLATLGLTREELIDMAILVGTDYNPGIFKVGPKTALKLVKKHGDNMPAILDELGQTIENWEAIKEFFLHPTVTDDYQVKWGKPEPAKIKEFLCEEHSFSVDRVDKVLERLTTAVSETTKQKTLSSWF